MKTMKIFAVVFLALLMMATLAHALTSDVPYYQYASSSDSVGSGSWTPVVGIVGSCNNQNWACWAQSTIQNPCSYTAYSNGYAQDSNPGSGSGQAYSRGSRETPQ